MGIVVWGIDRELGRNWPVGLRAAAGIPLGIVVYGLAVHSAGLEAWHDLRSLVIETAGNRMPWIGQLLGMRPQRLTG
jgi:hypothetical protein